MSKSFPPFKHSDGSPCWTIDCQIQKRLTVKKARIVEPKKNVNVFVTSEKLIRDLLKQGEEICFEGKNYRIVSATKPRANGGKGGEPKTDVFLILEDKEKNFRYIKISYKMDTAEFLENKITQNRAENIFGNEWETVLNVAAKKVLQNKTFVNKNGNAIVLGYRLDIMNTDQKNYAPLNLNINQLTEIYAGKLISENKRNAVVNYPNIGDIYPSSGVAEYILTGTGFVSAQNVIDRLQNIKSFIEQNHGEQKSNVFLAFKAVNFLLPKYDNKQKICWDGDRPLAFSVDWNVDSENKIVGSLDTNNPFKNSANTPGNSLKQLLDNGFSL